LGAFNRALKGVENCKGGVSRSFKVLVFESGLELEFELELEFVFENMEEMVSFEDLEFLLVFFFDVFLELDDPVDEPSSLFIRRAPGLLVQANLDVEIWFVGEVDGCKLFVGEVEVDAGDCDGCCGEMDEVED
jgi:hypothetical protein